LPWNLSKKKKIREGKKEERERERERLLKDTRFLRRRGGEEKKGSQELPTPAIETQHDSTVHEKCKGFSLLFSLSFQEERNGWNVFSKAKLLLYIGGINHYNMVLYFYRVTFSFMMWSVHYIMHVGPNFTVKESILWTLGSYHWFLSGYSNRLTGQWKTTAKKNFY